MEELKCLCGVARHSPALKIILSKLNLPTSYPELGDYFRQYTEKQWRIYFGQKLNCPIEIPQTKLNQYTMREIHQAITNTSTQLDAALRLKIYPGQLDTYLRKLKISENSGPLTYKLFKQLGVKEAEEWWREKYDSHMENTPFNHKKYTINRIHRVILDTQNIKDAAAELGLTPYKVRQYLGKIRYPNTGRHLTYMDLKHLEKEDAEKIWTKEYNLPLNFKVYITSCSWFEILYAIEITRNIERAANYLGQRGFVLKSYLKNLPRSYNQIKVFLDGKKKDEELLDKDSILGEKYEAYKKWKETLEKYTPGHRNKKKNFKTLVNENKLIQSLKKTRKNIIEIENNEFSEEEDEEKIINNDGLIPKPPSVSEIQEMINTSLPNESRFTVYDAIGDGNCAIHALFGQEYNGNFKLHDAEKTKAKMFEEILNSPYSLEYPELFKVVKLSILELIRQTDQTIPKSFPILRQAQEKWKHSQKQSQDILEEKWKSLEKEINNSDKIKTRLYQYGVDYLSANKDGSEDKKWLNFFEVEKLFHKYRGDGPNNLSDFFKDYPNFQRAYEDYGQVNQSIDLSEYFEEPLLKDTLKEYINFLKNREWLSAAEIQVLAYIFKITVEYYPTAKSNPMLYNPDQDETVIIVFNGVNHYLRGIRMSSKENSSTSDQEIEIENFDKKNQGQLNHSSIDNLQSNRVNNGKTVEYEEVISCREGEEKAYRRGEKLKEMSDREINEIFTWAGPDFREFISSKLKTINFWKEIFKTIYSTVVKFEPYQLYAVCEKRYGKNRKSKILDLYGISKEKLNNWVDQVYEIERLFPSSKKEILAYLAANSVWERDEKDFEAVTGMTKTDFTTLFDDYNECYDSEPEDEWEKNHEGIIKRYELIIVLDYCNRVRNGEKDAFEKIKENYTLPNQSLPEKFLSSIEIWRPKKFLSRIKSWRNKLKNYLEEKKFEGKDSRYLELFEFPDISKSKSNSILKEKTLKEELINKRIANDDLDLFKKENPHSFYTLSGHSISNKNNENTGNKKEFKNK